MKVLNKTKIFLSVILLLTSVTAFTWAIKYKRKVQPQSAVNIIQKEPQQTYDTVLLRKFAQVSGTLNIKGKSCTYSGVINILDKADSNQTAKNVGFILCKQGENCYYKMGNTETLNNGGIYMCIDHDHKKIFLGPQKTITLPDFANSSGLKNGLIGENYSLTQKADGSKQTLILTNEKHITCKEYAVTYDTTTLKPSRIFARMTNFNDPLNKDKEKIVDVAFSNWDNNADIDKYIDVKKILLQEGHQLRLTDNYKNYQLIRIQ